MYIAYIFSVILISFGAAATYLGISAIRKRFREYIGNLILGLLCFASAVWSYGFGVVFLTTNINYAYWGRTIGMIGVFAYMLLVQILVGILVQIPERAYYFFCIFAGAGFLLYFPVVDPSQTSYYMGEFGMTYTFEQGIISNIYSAYSVLYGINMFISIIIMLRHAENRRSKVASHKMLITLIIVFVGMVLDTILPMLGFGAIPGSSITQFLGLLVLYYAVVDYNKTRITPMNMSQYIYTSVSEPIMVFNKEGELKLANNAAKEVFIETYTKLSSSEMFLQNIFELADDHFNYKGSSRLDDSKSLVGNIPVQIQTNRIEDKYGDTIGFILTIKDMTRINSIMDSLVEAKQQAIANNIAKSAFLANMSHEIRTPLNAIVGFSELLLKSDISEQDKEQVDDIRKSSYNLLAIINDILDISKIESGKMELVESDYLFADIIKDVYHITENIASKKGLDFSMDIDEKIPCKLYGDPVRIRGILVNILNNAVKYTREGSVKLIGRMEYIGNAVAILRFEISDTGIGIKQEDKTKLFESFTQVDKKVNTGIEGTGLGLAIVNGFINLMSGSIKVDSEYGKGSTFTITIPQKIIDTTPIGVINLSGGNVRPKSAIGDVKFDGVKVLAVDDNKVNLKLIVKSFEKYGMIVETAANGPDSIRMCQDKEYDIVLMDQMMPEMDGIESMHEIRKISPYYEQGGRGIIIALTANAITGVREELIELGFDDYLSKPIEFGKMEEMFTELIKSGRLITA